ncbi:hypothetical protein BG000_001445 [Podila horticola]|nr:hypothetical protein BG000_001445 [Podila horticola]
MSEHDLNKVLTVYTPNLTTLVVVSIHMTSFDNLMSWHGFRPGYQLKYVASDYSIDRNSVQDLELRVVSKGELMQHQKEGAPVFEFESCGLVRPKGENIFSH